MLAQPLAVSNTIAIGLQLELGAILSKVQGHLLQFDLRAYEAFSIFCEINIVEALKWYQSDIK